MNADALAEREGLPLSKAALLLLEECRMVLPGIQGLFGFQMVAVFSTGFKESLSRGEQALHLVAVTLIVVAIALIMTPAALHRQVEPHAISARWLRVSTRLMLWSMAPLAIGLCLDFYLVARVMSGTPAVAWLAGALLAMFAVLWWMLPRSMRR